MNLGAPASPFRINTCKRVSKQRTLTTFRMNTYAKQGGGACPNTSARPASSLQYPASRTICATWRLYPLCPHSIAHTSCHHGPARCGGGVLPSTRPPPLHRSAEMPLCNSFACHSYANTRDGGATIPFQFFPSALCCLCLPDDRQAGLCLPRDLVGVASPFFPPASSIFSATSVHRSYCSQAFIPRTSPRCKPGALPVSLAAGRINHGNPRSARAGSPRT